MPLSLPALKVLRFFQTREYGICQRVRIRPALHAELERVMYRYITFILERNLKSIGFLNTLRRQNSPARSFPVE
jgi:DNA repair protein RecO (recombination protein O)